MQIETPARVKIPAVEANKFSPETSGSISVPKAAHSPSAILWPKATPR